jgi:hypothetical protein
MLSFFLSPTFSQTTLHLCDLKKTLCITCINIKISLEILVLCSGGGQQGGYNNLEKFCQGGGEITQNL